MSRKRPKNPPNMRLTHRDARVVMALHRYRMLTREQIKRLVFAPKGIKQSTIEKASAQRLKLLWEHKYLDRRPVPILSPTRRGQFPYVYMLDRKGADLVARTLGLGRDGVGWKKRHNKVKPLFLDHTLKLNDALIAVERELGTLGFEILDWYDERFFKSQHLRVVDPFDVSETLPFEPDTGLVFAVGEREDGRPRRNYFFVELDQATMTNKRFGDKVRAYLGYRAHVHPPKDNFYTYLVSHKLQDQEIPMKSTRYRVLTVTTTQERLENLVKVTEKNQGGSHFWFATHEQATMEGVLTAPIWHVAGREEPRSIYKLD